MEVLSPSPGTTISKSPGFFPPPSLTVPVPPVSPEPVPVVPVPEPLVLSILGFGKGPSAMFINKPLS